ncbi:MAG: hypothetical protein Q7J84_00255 [Sulfuricaulis sp.]|nr:hypothetical protein [Sulfuricaulis sp.]
MDLIGSIKYIEKWFGGRKHSRSKEKHVQKNTRNDAVGEKNVQSNAYHLSAEYGARLGRRVNITA